jgi:hypothetical protein
MEASPTRKRAAEHGGEGMTLGTDGVDGRWEVVGTEGHRGEHSDGGSTKAQRWWYLTPVHGLEQGVRLGGAAWRREGGPGQRGATWKEEEGDRGWSGATSSGGSRSTATRARRPRAGGCGCLKQRRWGANVWALVQYRRGLNQFKDFK